MGSLVCFVVIHNRHTHTQNCVCLVLVLVLAGHWFFCLLLFCGSIAFPAAAPRPASHVVCFRLVQLPLFPLLACCQLSSLVEARNSNSNSNSNTPSSLIPN